MGGMGKFDPSRGLHNALTAPSNPKFHPKRMGISAEIADGLTKRQAGFSTTFVYKKAYTSS
tara:strand:- start:317 stop:499 length:183 start_codon:yes stop_codon:yes gene_type:complete